MNGPGLHRVFVYSIVLKALSAAIEFGAGVVLFFISTASIVALVNTVTLTELVEDPNDLVATTLLHMAHALSISDKSFYAAYLVSHGLIKLALAFGLLRGLRWSYPAALITLGAFVGYQLYRYSYTHGLGLLLLTVFDIFVIGLIWQEWRARRTDWADRGPSLQQRSGSGGRGSG
jgi:uncharacterized membrane protein